MATRKRNEQVKPTLEPKSSFVGKPRALKPDSCLGAGSERGYMLAVLAVFTSVLLVTLTAAVINWQKAIQREREEELIFRGKQFMRAIELWQRKFPGTFPTTIDALLSTSNTRFLRKKWKDPITNAFDWRIIKMGPDGAIQGLSLSPGASPLGRSSFDSQSQGKSGTSGYNSQSLSGSSISGSGTGNQGGSQGLSSSQTSGNVGGLSTQSQGGKSQSPFSPVLGGIVGIASSSEKESIKTFNGKSKYSEWDFVFFTSGSPTGAGLPQAQPPPGQAGPGQGVGGVSSPGVVTPSPRPMLPGRSPMQ
jgi:type II secretory pathway pseudopilin PulG